MSTDTRGMNIEELRNRIIALLSNFETSSGADLRTQVLSLIPIWNEMHKLGCALLPVEVRHAARERLLYYFKCYPNQILSQHELAIVAGISEWARRVRELRVEYGWGVFSVKTAREMVEMDDLDPTLCTDLINAGPDDYIMISTEQDREAAFRWRIANDIRRKDVSVKARILEFLRRNVGSAVSGEELRYVARNRTEWARRVRELRTEDGWPISTYWNGRPELMSGLYLLEEDRQLPAHDRIIPDGVRREVLVRDSYTCQDCAWTRELWNPDDPRHLELHHIEHHINGGGNDARNLITLCNICHDRKHS